MDVSVAIAGFPTAPVPVEDVSVGNMWLKGRETGGQEAIEPFKPVVQGLSKM